MTKCNLLFICSRNQWRSPTAEKIARKRGFNTRSAGTSPNARRTVNANDIRWATHIIVMERKHRNRIQAEFSNLVQYKPVLVLDIPDEYRYMDPDLIASIEASMDMLDFD